MKEKVIIFSAPSGSGKTTLVKHALEAFPKLAFSVSCTTRSPRGTEVHGNDYYFINQDGEQKLNGSPAHKKYMEETERRTK